MPLMTQTASQIEEFSGFYTAHFGRIAGQLHAYLGDRWEAQDLTQEAFCRAFQRWETISVYQRPEAWVRQVAWNLATNRLRHLRLAMRYLAGQREQHAEGPNPDRVVLTAALAKLPPKHRLAVVLHHLARLSTSEIAQQQNVAEGTVRSWLSRGRTQLAEQLTEQLTEIPHDSSSIPAPGVGNAVSRVRRRRAVRRATLAAAIALAVVVPLAIILRANGSEPPFIGPTTPPSIPIPSPSPSAPPAARQTIGELALLAESAPAAPQPRSDQLILMTQIYYSQWGEHKQEQWLDPIGGIMLRYRGYELGILERTESEKDREKWIRLSRDDMKKVGPGLNYPTWEVLSTHTTDPQALLSELLRGGPANAGDLARSLRHVAQAVDALAPPELKAGLLRTLSLVDGVTAEQITAPDGSPVWAIGGVDSSGTSRHEVLVSAATGLIVGHREVNLFVNVYPSGIRCFLCTPRPVPTLSPAPPPATDNATLWWTTLTAK